ncbi:hypothetical protein Hanom_Chr14g01262991 [Helianthus anomalus]
MEVLFSATSLATNAAHGDGSDMVRVSFGLVRFTCGIRDRIWVSWSTGLGQ